MLVLYTVLQDNSKSLTEEELLQSFKTQIKTKLNPLFRPQKVIVVDKLPRYEIVALLMGLCRYAVAYCCCEYRTASNKIMRRVLRREYAEKHQQ